MTAQQDLEDALFDWRDTPEDVAGVRDALERGAEPNALANYFMRAVPLLTIALQEECKMMRRSSCVSVLLEFGARMNDKVTINDWHGVWDASPALMFVACRTYYNIERIHASLPGTHYFPYSCEFFRLFDPHEAVVVASAPRWVKEDFSETERVTMCDLLAHLVAHPTFVPEASRVAVLDMIARSGAYTPDLHAGPEFFARCERVLSTYEQRQCAAHVATYQEELMQRAWHPSRFVAWCLDAEEAREFV